MPIWLKFGCDRCPTPRTVQSILTPCQCWLSYRTINEHQLQLIHGPVQFSRFQRQTTRTDSRKPRRFSPQQFYRCQYANMENGNANEQQVNEIFRITNYHFEMHIRPQTNKQTNTQPYAQHFGLISSSNRRVFERESKHSYYAIYLSRLDSTACMCVCIFSSRTYVPVLLPCLIARSMRCWYCSCWAADRISDGFVVASVGLCAFIAIKCFHDCHKRTKQNTKTSKEKKSQSKEKRREKKITSIYGDFTFRSLIYIIAIKTVSLV